MPTDEVCYYHISAIGNMLTGCRQNKNGVYNFGLA